MRLFCRELEAGSWELKLEDAHLRLNISHLTRGMFRCPALAARCLSSGKRRYPIGT